MTGLLQIWKQCICFSGHAHISDNRTHYGNAQKQDKIFCCDQNNDLTDILKHQEPIVIQYSNIIHLMSIDQGFFIDQQIRYHRI